MFNTSETKEELFERIFGKQIRGKDTSRETILKFADEIEDDAKAEAATAFNMKVSDVTDDVLNNYLKTQLAF